VKPYFGKHLKARETRR